MLDPSWNSKIQKMCHFFNESTKSQVFFHGFRWFWLKLCNHTQQIVCPNSGRSKISQSFKIAKTVFKIANLQKLLRRDTPREGFFFGVGFSPFFFFLLRISLDRIYQKKNVCWMVVKTWHSRWVRLNKSIYCLRFFKNKWILGLMQFPT